MCEVGKVPAERKGKKTDSANSTPIAHRKTSVLSSRGSSAANENIDNWDKWCGGTPNVKPKTWWTTIKETTTVSEIRRKKKKASEEVRVWVVREDTVQESLMDWSSRKAKSRKRPIHATNFLSPSSSSSSLSSSSSSEVAVVWSFVSGSFSQRSGEVVGKYCNCLPARHPSSSA